MIGFFIKGAADFIKDTLNDKCFAKYSKKVKINLVEQLTSLIF